MTNPRQTHDKPKTEFNCSLQVGSSMSEAATLLLNILSQSESLAYGRPQHGHNWIPGVF